MSTSRRPQRYRHDREISATVDLTQSIEDRLREQDDEEGAQRAARARNELANLALGHLREREPEAQS